MATPRQLTQIAFAAPLDESTEDEVLDPSAGFPVVVNARQDYRGGVSKRLGYAAKTVDRLDEADRSIGRRLFPFRDSFCVSDGATLDTYTDDINVSAGRISEVSVTTRTLAVTGREMLNASLDVVHCNGFLVSAATLLENGGTLIAAVESVNGETIALPVKLDTGVGTMGLAAYGTRVMLLYVGGTSSVYQTSIDCSSLTSIAAGWSAPTALATDKITTGTAATAFSVQALTANVAIAYVNNSGGTSQVTVRLVTNAGSVQSTTINTASITPAVVGIEGSASDTLWVSWNQAAIVRVCGLSPTTITSVVATAADICSAYATASATQPPILVSGPGAGQGRMVIGSDLLSLFATWNTVAGAVVPTLATGHLAGAYPTSRGFQYNGRAYALFYALEDGDAVALCDITSYVEGLGAVRPVAMAFPRLARGGLRPGHIVALDSNRFAMTLLVQRSTGARSAELMTVDFADPLNTRSAIHNGQAFLSGGILTYFDRQRVVEANFLHAPAQPEPANLGTGVGPTGAVRYVAVYEEVDACGVYNQSGASTPSLSITGTGKTIQVSMLPLMMTARRVATDDTRVRIALYRNNPGGTTYYLVGSVKNDTSASGGVVTVDDTYSVSDLASRPLLYGTGNLPGTGGAPLQHDAPPFCQDVVSYNGMLVIASGSDLWWSGQTIGGEGTWFSTEQFFLTVDGEGDITALAVQDGTLYVFKERAIYIVGGDPPVDNGSSGGLGQPRRLAGDVGCVRSSSVVVTSLGIFFQSRRGIELLSGGGRPVWIGEKVQRTLASFPDVTSAVVDERNNLVRFTLTNGFDASANVTQWNSEAGQDLGGRDLVFDITLNDWQSVDDKRGSVVHQASQDAATIPVDGVPRYAWLASDGTVYVESDEYLDVDAWITMAVESGWFKVAGIQGRQVFERLLTLYRQHTACGLSVALGYEYRTTFEDASVRTDTQIGSILALGVPLQLRNDPSDNAEGQAVRVRVEDVAPDGIIGSGRGATWLAMTLNITPKEGPAEVPEVAA